MLLERDGKAQAGRTGRARRRVSPQRLRRWLLGGAVALILLITGFLAYARHQARKAILDLPHRLGADIRSETNGFTYSQTVKGRTLFTIHASRAIQRKDGKTTLHDVWVKLYGAPGTNRVDSIRGAEFEYDQTNGIVRAMGETRLDLASPANSGAAQPDAKRITVSGKGLVFMEKQGVAATQEKISFQYGDMRGEARGADYDAGTGVLHLLHDVHMRSSETGKMQTADADAAEIDRNSRNAVLHRAVLNGSGETLHASTLHVFLRQSGEAGSIQQVRGEGGVELVSSDGDRVSAPEMLTLWSGTNHPQSAEMHGGVRMDGPRGQGSAQEARLEFTPDGDPRHLRLRRSAHLHLPGELPGSYREIDADEIQGEIGKSATHAVLRDATAAGHAHLKMVDATNARQAGTTEVHAPRIHAFGAQGPGGWQISRVDAEGGAEVHESGQDGVERTSTADRMTASLIPAQASIAGTPPGDAASGQAGRIRSLVQEGHVVMVERHAATPASGAHPAKPATFTHASAGRSEYDGMTGRILLTGSPQVSDPEMEMAADRIAIARESGDAEATGSVRGTYAAHGEGGKQAAADADSGSLHFIAETLQTKGKGESAHLSGIFHPVRLWNGRAQMEAPVVDVDRATGRVIAHGGAGAAATPVKTVLPATPAQSRGVAKTHAERMDGAKPKISGSGGGAPLHILSRDVTYTQESKNAPGKAEFTGKVRLDAAGSQIFSDGATAILQGGSREKSSSAVSGGFMGGTVKRIIAAGHVRIQQVGRSATGDRLVYTVDDQKFELTGTPGALPVVRDSVQGSVTGASLIFGAGDDSVEVVGSPGSSVRTETSLPPRGGTGGERSETGKTRSRKP